MWESRSSLPTFLNVPVIYFIGTFCVYIPEVLVPPISYGTFIVCIAKVDKDGNLLSSNDETISIEIVIFPNPGIDVINIEEKCV